MSISTNRASRSSEMFTLSSKDRMDYLKTAFGGFSPHHDKDAAIKFVLNIVLMDNRLQELAELVVEGSHLGGMEGAPGWMLERRDIVDAGKVVAYPGWPIDACFMAHVDEDAYQLRHPECFMSRKEFMQYLEQAIDAYVAIHPSRAAIPTVIALRDRLE